MEYKLDDKLPVSDISHIRVIGDNYYLIGTGYYEETTWAELLERALMDKKAKYGSCIIIIEEPLSGKVFSFGNHDRKFIYEHGTTRGYA